MNGLLSGQLDFGIVTIADTAAVRGHADFTVRTVQRSFDYWIMNFCRTKPPFDDIRVRRAFQLALDRKAINEGWLFGTGEIAYGFWADDHDYFDSTLKAYARYDPDEARQLLVEAGMTPFSFELVFAVAQSTQPQRLGEIIQAQLNEIGVTTNIVFMPNIYEEFIEPQKPGILVNPGSRAGSDRVAQLFQTGPPAGAVRVL